MNSADVINLNLFRIADCYKLSTIEMKFNKIILILLAIGFVACGQENRLEADSELRKDIEETVTSGQKFLDIEKLTDFQWDSLIILTPYVNYHKIEDQYHINLSTVKHSDIELRDDISQLIFLRDGEPVRMVESPVSQETFQIIMLSSLKETVRYLTL